MKAVTWCGKKTVRVEDVEMPHIINPRDAIIKVSSTAICGSDVHIYDGYIPTMKKGDILGHEFMGEVVEVGPAIHDLKVGERVLMPFCISCGKCNYCQTDLTSLCDNSNPNAGMNEKVNGYAGSGLFGFSHLYGGYAGGQAEYVRVPYADVNAFKVPAGLPDDKVLFLTDIFPTGFQAADQCDIKPGDTIAVWGAGPVGQFVVRSCFLLGAGQVIAIDHHSERLAMAAQAGAVTINFDEEDLSERLTELTGGMGPDSCIDAVGLEAHGNGIAGFIDRAKTATYMGTDRPTALRMAIMACRKGGTVSIPGVYGGLLDKLPMGAAFAKGLTFKMGQTHVHKYLKPLLARVEKGEIDPSFVITHRYNLSHAAEAYQQFATEKDDCVKIVLKP